MVTKTSLRSWILAQAFPKTGETPSSSEGEDFSPSGASYLYLPKSSVTVFPPSNRVQAAWLARMARGALPR